MSMEMYRMWHKASVVEMRENHNVMVFKELLMAGDVELNPGPYPPGIFNFTIGILKGHKSDSAKHTLFRVNYTVPIGLIKIEYTGFN